MTVCAKHGGRAPQTVAAAERRLAEARVHQALLRMGVPIEKHPLEALIGALSEANGNVEFLRGLVNEALQDGNRLTDAAAQVIVRIYGEERDRVARFSQLALNAGVAERRARLAEQDARLMAQLIRNVLDHPALELSHAQRQLGRRLAIQMLDTLEAQAQQEPLQLASGGSE